MEIRQSKMLQFVSYSRVLALRSRRGNSGLQWGMYRPIAIALTQRVVTKFMIFEDKEIQKIYLSYSSKK